MPVMDAIRDLQNQTAIDQRQSSNGVSRNVDDVMGRHDFLMLLSAQLRHQDPLNPQSDSDFAAQLAQFSSLEQMMNMSESLNTMQAFGLVGQYVIAVSTIDGVRTEVAGVVDSIFTNNGVKFAQIGEYAVRVSEINEVFDGSIFPSSEDLIQTSNSLIGRTIQARISDGIVQGVVVGVIVHNGHLHAQIDDGGEEPRLVPVRLIFEVRDTPAGDANAVNPETPPVTERPPLEIPNIVADGEDYIELNEDGLPIRRWSWSEQSQMWVGIDIQTPTPEVEQEPEVENNNENNQINTETEPNPEQNQTTNGSSSGYYNAGNSYHNNGGSYIRDEDYSTVA